jgi:hypothetical protein
MEDSEGYCRPSQMKSTLASGLSFRPLKRNSPPKEARLSMTDSAAGRKEGDHQNHTNFMDLSPPSKQDNTPQTANATIADAVVYCARGPSLHLQRRRLVFSAFK